MPEIVPSKKFPAGIHFHRRTSGWNMPVAYHLGYVQNAARPRLHSLEFRLASNLGSRPVPKSDIRNCMETKQPHQHVSFVLRDDQSRLASWTVPVDHRLSLYQSVEVPKHFREVLMGYEPRAVVTRIEVNKSSPDHVELQAVCLTKKKHRPVIVLNSARIGGHRRMDIEAYLRSQLTHPLIYWESSTLATPVVRFNDPATALNACPSEIRSGILKQIYQSDDVRAA